ncbi:MAG TPA: pseudouridine synthase [Fervidobacterium sp.]|nr:rRNA pseudouridine synthase [Thermotogaceae bacterium]HCL98279.1 rRNA pseudouridine synthase [Fervidobacterium sp.]HOV53209.1 pseudouridine synthase [Fervidobacterium sp.]HQO04948.1 pseudouridine synthase [Fervidobacterium sp.]HUM76510.1 pseudouridine synthase [Fervidobacterium sp.]
MKLQKYLQQLGYSRRKADDLAFTGRIMVNNQRIEQPWYEINEGDVVSIDGVDYVVQFETRFEYYVLNKPKGYVSSLSDPKEDKTIGEILRKRNLTNLKPVGRLDKDASGVIILTNDGELINVLTSARYGTERVYKAKVKGKVARAKLEMLKSGIEDEGEFLKCEDAKIVEEQVGYSLVEVKMIKGKKHEVKRLFAHIGNPVVELVRTKYGPIDISIVPNQGDIAKIRGDLLKALLDIKRLAKTL